MAFQKKRIAVMLFFTAFWFYLFYVMGTVELSLTVAVLEIGMGIAGAALIFTLLRCVITPLFFGRAFCSWVCWSPGLFDLVGLYRGKTNLKKNKWLYLKYAVAAIMIFFGVRSLLAGNASFPTREVSMMKDISVITLGLLLAFPLGHRNFCRYLCPPGSLIAYFSKWGLLKIEGDQTKCKQCGTCETNCPMGVSAKIYVQNEDRIYDRECILCGKCIDICPEHALKYSFKRDKNTW
ncbi:MAG: 4Fe-4S binding protein [Candidatus Methanoperedens sp.]|nr:4Fe-4S binding protein [Candidatus Methanoperedens sp.]